MSIHTEIAIIMNQYDDARCANELKDWIKANSRNCEIKEYSKYEFTHRYIICNVKNIDIDELIQKFKSLPFRDRPLAIIDYDMQHKIIVNHKNKSELTIT